VATWTLLSRAIRTLSLTFRKLSNRHLSCALGRPRFEHFLKPADRVRESIAIRSSRLRRDQLPLDCCAVNEKQILITGATNDIGLAAAEALAAHGANLAIVGRSKTRTRIASARIRAAAGRGATVETFVADLSSQASLHRLAAELLARYPKLMGAAAALGIVCATRARAIGTAVEVSNDLTCR
jgi:FlaA1/EpsC-like NDP-sugar epimerase